MGLCFNQGTDRVPLIHEAPRGKLLVNTGYKDNPTDPLSVDLPFWVVFLISVCKVILWCTTDSPDIQPVEFTVSREKLNEQHLWPLTSLIKQTIINHRFMSFDHYTRPTEEYQKVLDMISAFQKLTLTWYSRLVASILFKLRTVSKKKKLNVYLQCIYVNV